MVCKEIASVALVVQLFQCLITVSNAQNQTPLLTKPISFTNGILGQTAPKVNVSSRPITVNTTKLDLEWKLEHTALNPPIVSNSTTSRTSNQSTLDGTTNKTDTLNLTQIIDLKRKLELAAVHSNFSELGRILGLGDLNYSEMQDCLWNVRNGTASQRTPKCNVTSMLEAVRVLMRGAVVESNATETGIDYTPELMIAAYYNDSETAKTLLEKDVDVNFMDSNGWTPLMFAAKNDNSEMARILLQAGANANLTNKDGWTASVVAQTYENDKVAKLISEFKANRTSLPRQLDSAVPRNRTTSIPRDLSWQLVNNSNDSMVFNATRQFSGVNNLNTTNLTSLANQTISTRNDSQIQSRIAFFDGSTNGNLHLLGFNSTDLNPLIVVSLTALENHTFLTSNESMGSDHIILVNLTALSHPPLLLRSNETQNQALVGKINATIIARLLAANCTSPDFNLTGSSDLIILSNCTGLTSTLNLNATAGIRALSHGNKTVIFKGNSTANATASVTNTTTLALNNSSQRQVPTSGSGKGRHPSTTVSSVSSSNRTSLVVGVPVLNDQASAASNASTNQQGQVPIVGSAAGSRQLAAVTGFQRLSGGLALPNMSKADLQRKLGQAAFDGNVADVKTLLSLNFLDVNWRDGDLHSENECLWSAWNGTALHRALQCNRDSTLDVVRVLIQAGANVNLTENFMNMAPLMMAAGSGDLESVRLILDTGTNVNAKDGSTVEYTALMWAARLGDAEMAKLLLAKGADITLKDSNGWTALVVAAFYQNNDVLEVLKAHQMRIQQAQSKPQQLAIEKARFNLQILTLQRRLAQAAFDGDLAMVTQLLQLGYLDVNWKDPNEKNGCNLTIKSATALLRAVHCNRGSAADILELLIGAGADVNSKTSNGYTALFLATGNGNLKAMAILLENGADVNAKDSYGVTPIALAVTRGGAGALKVLVDNGANINARDYLGWTPLMYAVKAGRLDMVLLLMDAGADVNVRDNVRRSALIIAATYSLNLYSTEIVQMLLDGGADQTGCFHSAWPLCPPSS